MGTVEAYPTSEGRRYRVRYRTPERKQTSKRGFKTKRDAELFLANVDVSIARGEFIDPASARVTVGDLGRDWLASKSATLKPSTFRAVSDAWRVYVEPRWGVVQVSAVRHSAVVEWVRQLSAGTAPESRTPGKRGEALAGRPKSATVVTRAHNALASVLEVAVRDRRIAHNPARGVALPRKVSKPHRYLTHAEVDRLAAAAGRGSAERATVIYVAAYTGMRWGELTGLRVRDVDTLRRRLSVSENAVRVGAEVHVGTPKTHKRRSVSFPPFLVMPIAKLCEGKPRDALLFGGGLEHLQRPRTSGASRSWFVAALAEAGLERMTIHDLRHTAASLAIASGANPKAVQKLLGHASAAMTLDVYADLFDDDIDAVSMALDQARIAAVVSK
ncbi:site-specific integrase [Microbacterium oleivorans]|uniref:Site-specific integrase n=2 Tax=Microbacterium oleivorans TaxID=273677 RepID=A0A7D5IUR3_9MICO|nr:site-specific integrase [Microbacterium oleivorans]